MKKTAVLEKLAGAKVYKSPKAAMNAIILEMEEQHFKTINKVPPKAKPMKGASR